MSLDVTVERQLPYSPAEVAAYAMDWRHDHEWTQGIKSAVLTRAADDGTDPEGFGIGAEVTRTAHFMRKHIDYVLRVAAYDPPRLLEMRSIAGPFPMHVTYRFDPADGGTRASIRVQGGPGRTYGVGRPLLAAMVRRNLRRDLHDLDRRLGERTAPAGD